MSLKRQVRLCHLSSKLSNSNNMGKGSLVDMLKGLSPLSRRHPATTFLLAIFLGTLGVHYIYLDKTTAGIIILLISLFGGVLTCGVLPGIIAVVVLIQGILMMTMSQDEFEKKYCDPANSFPLF